MHVPLLAFLLQPQIFVRRCQQTNCHCFAMPPNQGIDFETLRRLTSEDDKISVAIMGCGMMGQEHISYISGYHDLRIDYLCDPYEPSLEKAVNVMKQFASSRSRLPTFLRDESDLLLFANDIDLLVIASPNYLHTESIIKWGEYNLTILLEKPVAVSQEQHDLLQKLSADPSFIARIWVAMEYRYIPAIAKLLSLIPTIGDLKMCTIRENRYPFLHKIGAWNRDPSKTGDTLVEKCCHFFDLFRLITGKEISKADVRSIAQRGLNYLDEPEQDAAIMDAAFVIFPFVEPCNPEEPIRKQSQKQVMGCLELCMYAEGSRHQEEIIVTGTKVHIHIDFGSFSSCYDSILTPPPPNFSYRVVWKPISPRTRYTIISDQIQSCGKTGVSPRRSKQSRSQSMIAPT